MVLNIIASERTWSRLSSTTRMRFIAARWRAWLSACIFRLCRRYVSFCPTAQVAANRQRSRGRLQTPHEDENALPADRRAHRGARRLARQDARPCARARQAGRPPGDPGMEVERPGVVERRHHLHRRDLQERREADLS